MRSLALLLWVALVAASSYPDKTNCVAEDTEVLDKVMWWVDTAVRTDAYTLRTGDGCIRSDDPTSYVPGQFTSIHLRTHKYKGQFRGLLLYATDASGNRVGDWHLDWPNSNMFWKPQGACKNVSLMHLNGAEKYYHHEFQFIAPPTGTGTIEFHTLIKRGEANLGEFYYANMNQNLLLAEGRASDTANVWIQGDSTSTCQEACMAAVQKNCDTTLYNSASKWGGALQKDVLATVGCASPALASKDVITISKDVGGWCTYPSSGQFDSACTTQPPAGSTNICPCGSAGVPSFGSAIPAPATSCLNEFVAMGASSKSSSGMLSFLLVILTGAFLNQHKQGNVLLMLVCVLFCAYTVQAHNWVYSVSRSFNQASTYKPCRPKVNDVPHWQINQGQEFWMEWATGHDHYFYFTVVNAEDILLLENTTQNDLDNYIKACETSPQNDYMRGKGANAGAHWAKQHINGDSKANTKDIGLSSSSVAGPIYARNISEGDPLYFERHAKFGTYNNDVRWVYLPAFTGNDRRCSYFNSNLPHIVAVHRFVQVETVDSRAGDRDTARFTIELPTGYGRSSGQYILQYLWRGYFDCADVDVFPSTQPVALEAVGGRPLRMDEPQWNKVDHCQFEEIQSVQTSCSEVATNAARCLEGCVRNVNCDGVNVVPMWLPKTVYPLFSDRVGIPWEGTSMEMRGGCSRARFAGLSRDAKVCYGLQSRLPNNTHATYSVTDDPEDPLFYSTCFIKRSRWAFDLTLENTTGTAPIPVPPAWAFGDKCVDCDEWKASQENFNVPTWKLPDRCRNCETAILDPVPVLPGSIVARGYKCDGSYDTKTLWRYQSKTAQCSTVKCVKVLSIAGADRIEADECLAKARADTQCSEFVQHRVTPDGLGRSCECYVKADVEPCCGKCVPVDADFRDLRQVQTSQWNVYTVAKQIPDSTCLTGVKSADGVYCCSSTCKDSNDQPVCMPVPGLQVSFQDAAMVAPDGWTVDNGKVFGVRPPTPGYSSTLSTSWGWNCDFSLATNIKDRELLDGTNFHSTSVRPESALCPNPEWTVQVPNGFYQVDTLYSQPWQQLRGCKIQGVNNFDASRASLVDNDMVWISRLVNTTNSKLVLSGGAPNCGGYAAVVIYPKQTVPSDTYCQSLPGMCCPLLIDMQNRPCSAFEPPCKLA